MISGNRAVANGHKLIAKQGRHWGNIMLLQSHLSTAEASVSLVVFLLVVVAYLVWEFGPWGDPRWKATKNRRPLWSRLQLPDNEDEEESRPRR